MHFLKRLNIKRESLTGEFELPAAGVAVVFGSEVSDGVVPQVGRSKYHIVGPAGTFGAKVRSEDSFLFIAKVVELWLTHPFSPLLITEGSVRISPTPTHTRTHRLHDIISCEKKGALAPRGSVCLLLLPWRSSTSSSPRVYS